MAEALAQIKSGAVPLRKAQSMKEQAGGGAGAGAGGGMDAALAQIKSGAVPLRKAQSAKAPRVSLASKGNLMSELKATLGSKKNILNARPRSESGRMLAPKVLCARLQCRHAPRRHLLLFRRHRSRRRAWLRSRRAHQWPAWPSSATS